MSKAFYYKKDSGDFLCDIWLGVGDPTIGVVVGCFLKQYSSNDVIVLKNKMLVTSNNYDKPLDDNYEFDFYLSRDTSKFFTAKIKKLI